MTSTNANARTLHPEYVWWVKLPLFARHLSATLTGALLDGFYLVAWPRVAMMAPPLAMLLGLALGWSHFTFERVFSESWLVLLLVTVLGVLSGHLGVWFLGGFALGDFVLAEQSSRYGLTQFEQLFLIRLPLLIEYGLLAFMLVTVPLLTKLLIGQLRPSARWSDTTRFRIALLGHVVVTALLVFLWTQSVPVLIRPVFMWGGGTPSVEAVTLLQRFGWGVSLVAALASAGRMLLQSKTVSQANASNKLDRWQAQFAAIVPVTPIRLLRSLWLQAVGRALWITFMLAGLFVSWFDAFVLGALIVVLQAARVGVITLPLGRWPMLVARVPLLVRLGSGFVLVFVISRLGLQEQMIRGQSFRPIIMLTAITLIVFYLLNPAQQPPASMGETQAP